MLFDSRIMPGLIFAVIGTIFLGVGLAIYGSSLDLRQQIDRAEALPLLTLDQLANRPAGTEALLEGKIAERNPLHAEGFVAYIRSEYRGERCTRDDDGYQDCESVWSEDEWQTPELWLDLAAGRAQVVNTNYELQNAPVTWQSTDTLIEYQTKRYRGFKINSPVLAGGVVARSNQAPAFAAKFIYGGTRQSYLADQRSQAGSLGTMGFVFGGLGGLFVLIGGGLIWFFNFKW